MRSKEEFYSKVVKEIREILSDPENLKCLCPKIKRCDFKHEKEA